MTALDAIIPALQHQHGSTLRTLELELDDSRDTPHWSRSDAPTTTHIRPVPSLCGGFPALRNVFLNANFIFDTTAKPEANLDSILHDILPPTIEIFRIRIGSDETERGLHARLTSALEGLADKVSQGCFPSLTQIQCDTETRESIEGFSDAMANTGVKVEPLLDWSVCNLLLEPRWSRVRQRDARGH